MNTEDDFNIDLDDRSHGGLTHEEAFKLKYKELMSFGEDSNDYSCFPESKLRKTANKLLKNAQPSIMGRSFLLGKEQSRPLHEWGSGYEFLDTSDKYEFLDTNALGKNTFNRKAFTDSFFDPVKKRFYGVFEHDDKTELHQIQFDEYLLRTVPGKLVIKTKAKEQPGQPSPKIQSKIIYKDYFGEETEQMRRKSPQHCCGIWCCGSLLLLILCLIFSWSRSTFDIELKCGQPSDHIIKPPLD